MASAEVALRPVGYRPFHAISCPARDIRERMLSDGTPWVVPRTTTADCTCGGLDEQLRRPGDFGGR